MTRIPLLAAAALLAAGTLQAQKVDDSFRWSGRLAAGRTLEIRGVNGGITVRPASGDAALVRARKSSKRGELETVEIKVLEKGGDVTVCAAYPSQDGGDCTLPRERGGKEGSDVVVDFEVEVPAGVRFEGRTVNGAIGAEGLRGDAEVSTVNGGIDLVTAGAASATTVNGDVRLRVGRTDWKGTVEASTVNGRVVVEMPAPAGLEVDASTLNGSISSDFPLTLQGKMSPRRLRGRIGTGGPTLELKTVNGDVELKKAG